MPLVTAPRPGDRRLLLINPNSSPATTAMMLALAREAAGAGATIVGATATRAPPMIVEPEALAAAADEVVAIALAHRAACAGVIVGAFGDPGLAAIRAALDRPATGLCEAAVHEAAESDRRFGIATTTARLAAAIDARVAATDLGGRYTGLRLTEGDPATLAADPERLRAALAQAVRACHEEDGAEAVIIGGGPLAGAAAQLRRALPVAIVEPVPAAVRRLIAML